MERRGCVLVFKKDATKKEIKEALKTIEHVVDLDYWSKDYDHIETFDDKYGGPVWYLP